MKRENLVAGATYRFDGFYKADGSEHRVNSLVTLVGVPPKCSKLAIVTVCKTGERLALPIRDFVEIG